MRLEEHLELVEGRIRKTNLCIIVQVNYAYVIMRERMITYSLLEVGGVLVVDACWLVAD